jgi:UDP-N-acetylglucosamine/UDP-N-acetylgalactosamine 4-epimerase
MFNYIELQESLKKNQKTWLVTGAAGFIGSNIVEKLLILNQKVIGLDNFETGYQHNIDQAILDAKVETNNIEQIASNFQFIYGDIRDLESCQEACKGVDYVLHQAALGSVPKSIKNPINTNKSNIDGFLNMLVSAKDAKVKNFVYAASSATYGDHSDLPKIESKIGNPLSPYAVTKLVNELYAQVFAKTYNFNSIGLRYFNIFGKRQDPKGAYAAVIPKWTEALIKGEEVFINGDGTTSRDFCFIENTVQMNLLAATSQNLEAHNQIFNVAHNERTSLNELYQILKNLLQERITLKTPSLKYRDFRTGDILHSQANINKAKKLLNYKPNKNFIQGMESSIDWYIRSLLN